MRIGWVLTAVLACISRLTLAAKPLSNWRQGIATFYGGAPDGMVSFSQKRVKQPTDLTSGASD